MVIDLCPENPTLGVSPRISFSHDLSQSDIVPVEQRLLRSISSSSVDFDFGIGDGFNQESSSADELFSDGKMLPTQVKKKMVLMSPQLTETTLTPPPPPPATALQPQLAAAAVANDIDSSNETGKAAASSESSEKQKSKSFWQFKRSSSLNCGSGYARSLCPLPLLSRSNSTGSASSSKRSSSSKDGLNHKQHSQKTPVFVASSIKQSQSSLPNYGYQKPPLKKNGYGSHGNGVRVNPVLNVPSANLFGLGSIFIGNNSKDQKNKKR